MLIGPSGQTGQGQPPAGKQGVQNSWNQLWWDLRYNWPQRWQNLDLWRQKWGG